MIPGIVAGYPGSAPLPPDPAAESIWAKLVSWWDFDSDLRDKVGPNHLTGTGSYITGHIGNMIDKTSRAEILDPLVPTIANDPGISFGGWVYVDGTGAEDIDFLAGSSERYRLAFRNGNQVTFVVGQSGATSVASSVGAISTGNFCFVVGTLDFSTREMKLYIGDALIGTATASPSNMGSSDRISFGRPSGNVFTALHNDASFMCSGVLTLDEVQWLYNGGAGRSGDYILSVAPHPSTPVGVGAWTWFNDPRAISAGSQEIVGAVSNTGKQVLYYSSDDFDTSGSFLLDTPASTDDHGNPAFLRRSSDNRIVAAYVAHNSTTVYGKRVSTNADDASAWGAQSNIIGSLGATAAGYANLVEVEAEDLIFDYYRDYPLSYVSQSSDDGASFGTGVNMLSSGSERPYIKAVQNGVARVDFLVTDGHPNEYSTSVYHYYYEGGAYYDSSGASAGSLPLAFSALTQLWDGTGVNAHSWVWDIVPDGSDVVAVYAIFPTTSDHRYRYARYSGGVWTQSEVCADGGPLYAGQPYYSGGICIDPDDPDYVYACRMVSGEWGLYRYHTSDGGATWDAGTLIFKRPGWQVFRPYIIPGSGKVYFCTGVYTSYTNFATQIRFVNK